MTVISIAVRSSMFIVSSTFEVNFHLKILGVNCYCSIMSVIRPNFIVQGNKISTVHQYEYLGILLDDKLSMNNYLDSMWKKANSKLGILSKIRHFISEKTAVRIYKTMIRPHLDYIDFVVESGSADHIRRLDDLQKKAIRRIEYCINVENRQDKKVLQGKYKIDDLVLRRKRNLVKIIHTLSADRENLKTVSTVRELRSMTKVKMKNDFTSKTKVFNSPFYRGIWLWGLSTVWFTKRGKQICFQTKDCIAYLLGYSLKSDSKMDIKMLIMRNPALDSLLSSIQKEESKYAFRRKF